MVPHLSRGFTLPEILLVLAIVGVLTGLAVPPLGEALARYRLRGTVEALTDTLQRARAAAVRCGHVVLVCPSRDGRTCAADIDWAAGWIVVDADLGNPGKDAILERFDSADRHIATTGSTYRQGIRFQPGGVSSGDNQRITLCLRRKPGTATTLVISNAGRLRREASLTGEAATCARSMAKKR